MDSGGRVTVWEVNTVFELEPLRLDGHGVDLVYHFCAAPEYGKDKVLEAD